MSQPPQGPDFGDFSLDDAPGPSSPPPAAAPPPAPPAAAEPAYSPPAAPPPAAPEPTYSAPPASAYSPPPAPPAYSAPPGGYTPAPMAPAGGQAMIGPDGAPGTIKAASILFYIHAALWVLVALAVLAVGHIFHNHTIRKASDVIGIVLLVFAVVDALVARGVAHGSRFWWFVGVVIAGLGLVVELYIGRIRESALVDIAELILLWIPVSRAYCSGQRKT